MPRIDVRPDSKREREQNDSRLIRELVSRLLRESDWTMLPDSPLTAPLVTQWITYRSTLRQIASQVTNGRGLLLPDPPSDPNNRID